MIFGGFFIILFFGLFGSILTLNTDLLNNSALFASLYTIWFFIVKKLTNSINSDGNGVIRY
jgi:Kef-type K+ transport system membrane component KefB